MFNTGPVWHIEPLEFAKPGPLRRSWTATATKRHELRDDADPAALVVVASATRHVIAARARPSENGQYVAADVFIRVGSGVEAPQELPQPRQQHVGPVDHDIIVGFRFAADPGASTLGLSFEAGGKLRLYPHDGGDRCDVEAVK